MESLLIVAWASVVGVMKEALRKRVPREPQFYKDPNTFCDECREFIQRVNWCLRYTEHTKYCIPSELDERMKETRATLHHIKRYVECFLDSPIIHHPKRTPEYGLFFSVILSEKINLRL